MKQTMGVQGAVQHLQDNNTEIILLFNDNLTKIRFTDIIRDAVKNNVFLSARISNANPFRVTLNLVQLGSSRVLFGLVKDEPLLFPRYSQNSIFHYDGSNDA